MERPLSTLEYMALGLVWRKGPCTPYAVMKSIAQSKAQAFRSGAGSIYPLIKRLTGTGLIALSNGKLVITGQGSAELARWVSSVDPERDVTANLDPLRARLYFLKVLRAEDQVRFLEQAEAGLLELQRKLEMDKAEYEQNGDPIGALAIQGAILETEARNSWIDLVRKRLGHGVSTY